MREEEETEKANKHGNIERKDRELKLKEEAGEHRLNIAVNG